jgi:hypothetical protein
MKTNLQGQESTTFHDPNSLSYSQSNETLTHHDGLDDVVTTRSGRRIRQRILSSYLADDDSHDVKGLFAHGVDMTIKQALNGSRPNEAKQAILSEIQNMIDYSVGHFVHYKDIPESKKSDILRSFMFIKEKFRPNKTHDKTKARLVGDGSRQGANTYDIISSTTVDLCSVFLLLSMASYLACEIVCYDIKGAFLNASFTTDDEDIYLKIGKELVSFWKILDNSVENFTDQKGDVYMKLDKFIYGLKQSPAKFQKHLSSTLLSAGYNQLINDDCLFLKKDEDNISILSTHVDDIMQICNCDVWKQELRHLLMKVYTSIDMQQPATSYLGMDIRRGNDISDIYISQPKLTSDIIETYLANSDKTANTPSRVDILDCYDINVESHDIIKNSDYLSLVMKLMYLARLTRPDILFSVSYLATKSQNPTSQDWKDAIRIVKYLNGTQSHGIHINCSNLDIFAHCDASYGTHHDGKGHTGFILSVGNTFSYLHARSVKQKIGSISSTDAEIIATKSCCQMIKWIREILLEINIESIKPTILYQDNKSAIVVCTSDKTRYKRVKHMLTSIGYIRSLVQSQDISIKYLDTNHMTADMLTKSLGKFQHQQHTISCGVKDLKLLH